MKDAILTYFSVIFSLMIFSAYAGYESGKEQHVSQAPQEFALSGLNLEKYEQSAQEYPDVLPSVQDLN